MRVQVPLTARMVKLGAMALKAVVPGVPKSVRDRELLEEDVATLPALLSLDPLILTSKHYKHQPYTCHTHLGSALNLLP